MTKGHVTSRQLIVTYVALLVLTASSLLAAFAHLGVFEMPVALGIALVKAVLVILFFMHLIEEPGSHRLAVVVAFLFIVLLAGFMVADPLTRPVIEPSGGVEGGAHGNEAS